MDDQLNEKRDHCDHDLIVRQETDCQRQAGKDPADHKIDQQKDQNIKQRIFKKYTAEQMCRSNQTQPINC